MKRKEKKHTLGGFQKQDRKKYFFRKIKKLFKKKSQVEILKSLEKVLPESHRLTVAIYESELQNIGLESTSWDSETGGDLFGVWTDIPIIYLVTLSGPNAIRDQAHFKLDVDYLIGLSTVLQQDWGLRYFGDWHSHHKLGLRNPSGGDQNRIKRLAKKNSFQNMIEFIVTFSPQYDLDRKIVINPYHYYIALENYKEVAIIVLKGLSPIRQVLSMDTQFPEQKWNDYKSFPTHLIQIPNEPLTNVPEREGFSIMQISERVFSKAVAAFSSIITDKVELHPTTFGSIIVVPVDSNQNVAFAVDREWPHKILEVDWLDRSLGKSEELKLDINSISLLNIKELKSIFLKVKELKNK